MNFKIIFTDNLKWFTKKSWITTLVGENEARKQREYLLPLPKRLHF